MFKKLINDKIETIAKLSDGIEEILKSDEVSEISENNKPFEYRILPEEIGLDEFKVDSPVFRYKGKSFRCYLRKLNIRRISSLNTNFNSLNKNEKENLLKELIPILKKQFTHIYDIIEKRNHFIVNGYVENYVGYICYGTKIGY